MVYPTEAGRQDAANDKRVGFPAPPPPTAPRQGEETATASRDRRRKGGGKLKKKKTKTALKSTAPSFLPAARRRQMPRVAIIPYLPGEAAPWPPFKESSRKRQSGNFKIRPQNEAAPPHPTWERRTRLGGGDSDLGTPRSPRRRDKKSPRGWH